MFIRLFSGVVVVQMEGVSMGRVCCAFNQALTEVLKFFWKGGCRDCVCVCACACAAVHVAMLELYF